MAEEYKDEGLFQRLGKLFQSTSIDKEQRELLIFITPNVVG